MRTINLEEIFEKQNPQDGVCPEWAKNFTKEVVKQALELAAEKLRQTSGQFNSDYTDEKRRILNTINQVI